MKYVAAIALVASVAFAERCRDRRNMRLDRTVPCGAVASTSDAGTPFLVEFAPADGGGMGAACDCADITTSDGVAAVFTRNTVGYCTKGSWWTGIANGDVVECPVNKPVIEPGNAGTGQLRYLSELAGSNYVKDSEDFTAGSWASLNLGAAACTVSNPDAGISPRGDNTATRIRCPATTAGQYTFIYQADAVSGAPASGSIYVRSYAAANTAHYAVNDNIATTWVDCAPGAFAAGWMRCVQENVTNGIVLTAFGSNNVAGTSAFDVLVWGAKSEVGKGASSYIKTSGGTGTRGETLLYFPSPVPATADLTVTASMLNHVIPAFGGSVASLSNGATNMFSNLETASALQCHLDSASVTTDATTANAFVADAVNTTTCNYDGTSRLAACLNSGSCVDGGVNAAPVDYDKMWAGTLVTGSSQPNAWIGPIGVSSSAQKDIYLFGDGVVDGFPTYACLPQTVIHAAEGNSVGVSNLATTGDKIETCQSEWTTVVSAVRTSGARRAARTYLMVQCGLNGMTDGGTDAGQISDILQAMMLDAQDAGITHAMWSTITPFSSNAVLQARGQQVNATMSAFCTSNGFYQADTFTALGGPGCDTSLVQCADGGVHLQDAGQIVETNLWRSRGGW